ncbi:MAG: FAD-binding oxidoreductase [Ktedonobacteraceae bacterium]
MTTTNVEIAIIGGGVIGNSIAYHLTRQGRQVLVIERSSIASTPAASWASAGGVRRQGRHPAEAKLASEAIERWKMLEQELEADLQYRSGGNLLLAESDAEAEQLAAFIQQQHAMGFAGVRLVERREVLELVAELNDRVVAGSYSPADGQADPPRTTRAFANAAGRHGATYWTGTSALALLSDSGRVSGVRTERGEVSAQHVVLAAGAWSDELALTIGLRLPIRTYALQMLLSTAAPSVTLQPVLSAVSRQLSLKQLNDGAFLIGGGWLGDATPDRRAYTMRQASIEANWATACELLPTVGKQQIARSWCGLEAESFDNIPFIGPAPGLAGLTIAAGFSGHGFALAPAVGRAVADQINDRPAHELDGLSPDRIAHFQADLVEAFLTSTNDEQNLE